MRMLPSALRRLLCAVATAGLGLLAADGGSCLRWRRSGAAPRSTMKEHP